MPTKEHSPLAAMEVPASGGPFRQFALSLEDGTRIYVSLQTIDRGLDMTPRRPNNDQINETIGILARSRAFG